jgi:RNA polymerase sigma factor (sigma-70 family)
MTLSPRQKEIIILYVAGLRRREIAEQLGIREATVKTHLRDAVIKLGSSSRRQTVEAAKEMGLI